MAYGGSYFSKMPIGKTLKQRGSMGNEQFLPMVENFNHFHDVPVEVSGLSTILKKMKLFENANLSELVLGNISKMGYYEPSAIQQHAIPYVLQGRDVMGISPTGSGKTAAYAIPLLDLMIKMGDIVPIPSGTKKKTNKKRIPLATAEPRTVIILPNAESGNKVKEEIYNLSRGLRIKVQMITEGKDTALAQMAAVQRGCDILIATPTRLLDFMRKNYVCMRKCKYLVFDDGSRMLDMGFQIQIQSIMEHHTMPPSHNRQTLFFSTTASKRDQVFFGDYMVNHIFITLGDLGTAAEGVEQELLEVRKCDKQAKLFETLEKEIQNWQSSDGYVFSEKKILIFATSKTGAASVSAELEKYYCSVTTLHSYLEKQERDDVVKKFKRGAPAIMVVTAAAAKGLDLKCVDLVINYDLPREIGDYKQRLGFTGRKGRVGRAISFFDPGQDRKLAKGLLKVMQSIPDWLRRYGGTARRSPGRNSVNEEW